ncbi:AAEL010090-PA [Aedes aegypti]|uniref:AAEL010090-PA n=1 Tax=Aedes aegypti TaxID=7159 RepID=Q16TY0_AEDAE|nr:AAEL010090-PA [Aedes aegypti]
MAQISISRTLACLFHMRNIAPRHQTIRSFSTTNRPFRKAQPISKEEESEVKDEPIKYFNSAASRWKAEQTRSGQVKLDMPWFQPYVVNLSVVVFLLYFCVLREENDIDRGLESSLYDHIPGLEQKQLLVNYNYNKENGLSTVEIEKRMQELGMEY